MDDIIERYAAEIQNIVQKGTAVENTWHGLLSDMLMEAFAKDRRDSSNLFN